MGRTWHVAAAVVVAAAMGGCCMCWLNGGKDKDSDLQKKPQGAAWTPLFNGKDLTGFYTYLQRSGKNHDPEGIFKVENGMIHIMGIEPTTAVQETGYLCTEKEYGNYDLRFEYKWGEKKFAPRANQPRDSGCHYLLTGPDKVWADALECQVQEGETGDLYLLNGAYQVFVTVKSVTARDKVYEPATEGGAVWNSTGTHILRSETADSLTGWNQVEVIVDGNSSTHIVNGKTVMHVTDIVRRSDKTPIAQGRIAFQEEAAEMWYRNIEIRPLK